MYKTYQNAPLNLDGRLEKEIKTYEFLNSLGIEYFTVDHESAMTMEVCEQIEDTVKAKICKNLLLCNRQQTEFYLLMMPGDKKFKTKEISAQLGTARLSFASAEQMEMLVNITPGSLSVMGLLFDKDKKVSLVIDEDIFKEKYVGVHPCINTSTIRIKTDDLVNKIIPALKRDFVKVKLLGED